MVGQGARSEGGQSFAKRRLRSTASESKATRKSKFFVNESREVQENLKGEMGKKPKLGNDSKNLLTTVKGCCIMTLEFVFFHKEKGMAELSLRHIYKIYPGKAGEKAKSAKNVAV